MSPKSVGPTSRTTLPTPPATPELRPKRGWETTPTRPTALPTPPNTPPLEGTSAQPNKRSTLVGSNAASVVLQRPNTIPTSDAPITVDAAGHRPMHRSVLKTLTPAERNMHDHWYGRKDRDFHSHAKEFEMLAEPITSWQSYMALAKSVVAAKDSATTSSVALAHGKTGIYDSARNLFVVCATRDAHIITMYRPGLNLLPESQRPKVLGPLAQGQRYVAKLG